MSCFVWVFLYLEKVKKKSVESFCNLYLYKSILINHTSFIEIRRKLMKEMHFMKRHSKGPVGAKKWKKLNNLMALIWRSKSRWTILLYYCKKSQYFSYHTIKWLNSARYFFAQKLSKKILWMVLAFYFVMVWKELTWLQTYIIFYSKHKKPSEIKEFIQNFCRIRL